MDATVPLLLSFCHPEVRLVNVPSESIGLRDGGAPGVAGYRSEPSIHGTWKTVVERAGCRSTCLLNKSSLSPFCSCSPINQRGPCECS